MNNFITTFTKILILEDPESGFSREWVETHEERATLRQQTIEPESGAAGDRPSQSRAPQNQANQMEEEESKSLYSILYLF